MSTKLLQQTPGPSAYIDADYYQRLYGIAREWSNPGQPVSPELYYEITACLTASAACWTMAGLKSGSTCFRSSACTGSPVA